MQASIHLGHCPIHVGVKSAFRRFLLQNRWESNWIHRNEKMKKCDLMECVDRWKIFMYRAADGYTTKTTDLKEKLLLIRYKNQKVHNQLSLTFFFFLSSLI